MALLIDAYVIDSAAKRRHMSENAKTPEMPRDMLPLS
jgi:hypothetical protein